MRLGPPLWELDGKFPRCARWSPNPAAVPPRQRWNYGVHSITSPSPLHPLLFSCLPLTLTAEQAPKVKRRRVSSNASVCKKLKVSGRRTATAKKVTAKLDSDDELIVRMKNAKYLEKDIAQRLQDEGRISYNPKTIGTRWSRLKKVMQKQQDELLDAELTDWHEGDVARPLSMLEYIWPGIGRRTLRSYPESWRTHPQGQGGSRCKEMAHRCWSDEVTEGKASALHTIHYLTNISSQLSTSHRMHVAIAIPVYKRVQRSQLPNRSKPQTTRP